MKVSNEHVEYHNRADDKGVGISIDNYAITAAERAELLQLRSERPALIDQVEAQKKSIEWYQQ